MPNAITPPTPAASRVFVARQPILDRTGGVFGYELLYRAALPEPIGQRAVADERATAHILTDGLLAIGLDALTGGRRAFIKVSRQLLIDGVPGVLAPRDVVVELGADVEADGDVIDACQGLRQAGYGLAVDNFLLAGGGAELVRLADFIKIDFSFATSTAERAALLSAVGSASCSLIAARVDAAEQFQQAVTEGYGYFQGAFFGRPVVKEGRTVPSHQIAQLRLLRTLNDPNASVHQIAELIKPDPSMCYRVLRAVNSAHFALQTTVGTIHEALLLLGRDTVRRWASLWSLASLGGERSAGLISMATVRARCCELLVDDGGVSDAGAEGFLLGMCSMLDAILERPMAAIVADLPLPGPITAALLGGDNAHRRLLDCAVAYERGDWDTAIEQAEAAGVNPAALSAAYTAALRWAHDLDRLGAESAA